MLYVLKVKEKQETLFFFKSSCYLLCEKVQKEKNLSISETRFSLKQIHSWKASSKQIFTVQTLFLVGGKKKKKNSTDITFISSTKHFPHKYSHPPHDIEKVSSHPKHTKLKLTIKNLSEIKIQTFHLNIFSCCQ